MGSSLTGDDQWLGPSGQQEVEETGSFTTLSTEQEMRAVICRGLVENGAEKISPALMGETKMAAYSREMS